MRTKIGFITVDLPWNLEKHGIEIITLPLMSTGMAVTFAFLLLSLVVLGAPVLSLKPWFIMLATAVSLETSFFTYFGDSLDLPIDTKGLEGLLVIGAGLGAIALDYFSNGISRPAITFPAGAALIGFVWYFTGKLALMVSKTLPPPDERMMNGKASQAMLEQLLGTRIKRELYRNSSMETVHLQWIKLFLLSVILLALAFSIYAQYHASPLPMVYHIVVLAVSAVYLFCGTGLVFLFNVLSKEQFLKGTDKGSSIIKIGGGWRLWIRNVLGIVAFLAIFSVITPGNLSPIASENFDELSQKVNRVMDSFTRHLFTAVQKEPANATTPLNSSQSRMRFFMLPIPQRMPQVQGGGFFDGLKAFAKLEIALIAALALFVLAKTINKLRKLKLEVKVTPGLSRNLGKRILQSVVYIVSLPRIILGSILEYIRLLLLPHAGLSLENGAFENGNPLVRALKNWRKWVARAMLPKDPSKLIKVLYGKMLEFGRSAGSARNSNMTPSEYARYLGKSINSINSDRLMPRDEIDSLTSAFEWVKYSSRPATPTLAEKAVMSWRRLHSSIRKLIR